MDENARIFHKGGKVVFFDPNLTPPFFRLNVRNKKTSFFESSQNSQHFSWMNVSFQTRKVNFHTNTFLMIFASFWVFFINSYHRFLEESRLQLAKNTSLKFCVIILAKHHFDIFFHQCIKKSRRHNFGKTWFWHFHQSVHQKKSLASSFLG